MFTSVTIENFRCFERLELQKLGRVNLLVGKNNCGKTSVLEAVRLLCEGTDSLNPIFDALGFRREFIQPEIIRDGRGVSRQQFDVRCLFHGRNLKQGQSFCINGINAKGIVLEFKAVVESDKDGLFPTSIQIEKEFDQIISINFRNASIKNSRELGVNSVGGVIGGDVYSPRRPYVPSFSRSRPLFKEKSLFVPASSLDRQNLIALFESISLMPEENDIVLALKIIDSGIERIATNSSLGEFKVLTSEGTQPVSLGSLGEGVSRMLGIAISLVSVKGGFLFIDDIDTGLHYSTMEKMWELVWETAKKLDVQVFATTHSDDCWRSLATIAERDDAKTEGVSIQRIEKGKTKAINFTGREIVIAAERLGEVR